MLRRPGATVSQPHGLTMPTKLVRFVLLILGLAALGASPQSASPTPVPAGNLASPVGAGASLSVFVRDAGREPGHLRGEGLIRLHDGAGALVAEAGIEMINGNGRAELAGLSAGTYEYDVYFKDPDWGWEYWGHVPNVVVAGGRRVDSDFERNAPRCVAVRFGDPAGGPAPGTKFAVGKALRIELDLANGMASRADAQVRVMLTNGARGERALDQTHAVTLEADGLDPVALEFVPPETGPYDCSVVVTAFDDRRLTGGWTLNDAFFAFGSDVDVPILLYHNIDGDDVPCSGVWVTRRLFGAQMAALDAYGYRTVTLQDFLRYRNGDEVPPNRPIVITFDDGNDNFFTQARPLLDAHGFTATHFLPTGYIGETVRQDNSWDLPEAACPAYKLLWPEVAQMQAEGHAFESHSVSHAHLADLSREVAQREIVASRLDLENRLGHEVRFFAYPYGDGALSGRIRELVKDAGYWAAVSTQQGVASTGFSDVWALPRIKITEENSTRLDPAHPDDFFMRKVDPHFPLPQITVDGIDVFDKAGGRIETLLRPGDTVSVRVDVRNSGDPFDVQASLRVAAGGESGPLYDSHAQGVDVTLYLAGHTTQRFEYDWTIPVNAIEGDYRVEFAVYDRYRVLEFFRSGGDALEPIHVRAASGAGSTQP